MVGGDRDLFLRKGGASQKKIGKHWSKSKCRHNIVETIKIVAPSMKTNKHSTWVSALHHYTGRAGPSRCGAQCKT